MTKSEAIAMLEDTYREDYDLDDEDYEALYLAIYGHEASQEERELGNVASMCYAAVTDPDDCSTEEEEAE